MRKTASQIADEVLTKVAAGMNFNTGAGTPQGVGTGVPGMTPTISMSATTPPPTPPQATGVPPKLKPPQAAQQVKLPSTTTAMAHAKPAVPAKPPAMPKPTAGKATGLK